jgi:hypothetical protein
MWAMIEKLRIRDVGFSNLLLWGGEEGWGERGGGGGGGGAGFAVAAARWDAGQDAKRRRAVVDRTNIICRFAPIRDDDTGGNNKGG